MNALSGQIQVVAHCINLKINVFLEITFILCCVYSIHIEDTKTLLFDSLCCNLLRFNFKVCGFRSFFFFGLGILQFHIILIPKLLFFLNDDRAHTQTHFLA